jgi:glycosyltransferase involved in cell wall biosynthesis
MAALRLARGLRDRGHDPRVVFLYRKTHIAAPDHPYEVLVETERPGSAAHAHMLAALARRMRRDPPDHVLTFMPLAHFIGQAAATLAGVQGRIVSHRTPVNTIQPLMRGVDAVSAWLGLYRGVVAVSESVRATCGHYPRRLRDRTTVVYNGLRDWQPSQLSKAEARRRFALADGTLALVAVGRLAAQKNYPFMLRVLQHLDDVTLLIAGDGPERTALEVKVAMLGVDDKVRFLGGVSRSDIPDLLAAADIFVQTSAYEGHSNAMLEALQASLPIVAQDIPEQREVIADATGATAGILVRSGDPGAWAAAIDRLRNDSGAAARAREMAAVRAKFFDYETMITGFERALCAAEP